MIYPKIPLAQSVLEICKAKGIQHIVISPGSRNAPLTIGFTNNPYFTCYSIADERCAAFFALGIAQQMQQPVAVVCTSGSALLNYYPAVAEAFYNEIPLVVISADRPHDKIDIGDGQTIRQENVFANHILYNANLTEDASEENDLKIQEALFLSITKKGPVHINAPFEEPLYETIDKLSITPTLVELFSEATEKTDISEFATTWNRSPKKLVVLGGNYPNAIEQQFLDTLGDDSSVVVMTEATSNAHHQNFITNIDTIITPFTEEDFVAFQPGILITVGGMIVSKRIKAFLRKYKPKHHWHVDELRAYNTFGCLSQHFQVKPNVFFSDFFKETIVIESDYRQKTLEIRDLRAKKHQEYLDQAPFSDLKVFETILAKLQTDIQLQISNSSPIRYGQLFPIDKSIAVFCNRGTSGIDGSTTTAIGASVANNKPTVFITGDISFFYDSNALWNNYIPNNFKIILINNSGGGIFRILPGHQETDTFNTYFETSHTMTAEHLAKMYGFDYLAANDLNGIESRWNNFTNAGQPVIFEIFTPEKSNNKILLDYFKKLR
ncbi:MAG: 2-succinyl-5-enolpyruvyl-6-hydroxy-3-cyclohexene-1-carboxylic-acid synthase [Bacteroidota bacterium]